MYIQSKGHIIATGFLPRDAELRTVGAKGSSLCTFSLKVDETGENGEKEAKWLKCKCWHRLARTAALLEKGDLVLVAGKLEQYTGKDGKTYTNLVCEMVLPQQYEELPSDCGDISDSDDFQQTYNDDVPF